MTRTFSSFLAGLFYGVIVFVPLALATTALAAPAGDPVTNTFQSFVDLLKSGGPLSVAVLAGWWAYRKDKEKNDAVTAAQAQMKEMYEKVLGIASGQTQASVQMAGAVTALKDAVVALGGKIDNELRERAG